MLPRRVGGRRSSNTNWSEAIHSQHFEGNSQFEVLVFSEESEEHFEDSSVDS